METLKIIAIVVSLIGSVISLAAVFVKMGSMMEGLNELKKTVKGLKKTVETEVTEINNTIEKNRLSARKAIYDDSGAEKFAREEKFDKFREDVSEFQKEMRGFKTETLLGLQSVTDALKNMNNTITNHYK